MLVNAMAAVGVVSILALAPAAYADDKGAAAKPTPKLTAPSKTVNPAVGGASLAGPLGSGVASPDFKLKMPRQSAVRLLDLNLDLDSFSCLADEANCLVDAPPVDMEFSASISSKGKKGLDVELVPSASMRFDEDGRSASLGAVVRIGEDLRAGEVNSNTWYVFAGADAEALSYSSDNTARFNNGQLGLNERMIIGDAQAGIGYRIGAADVSLGYIRREISTLTDQSFGTQGFNKTEDAAALSFTWKR
jgi:hypothetical protein